MAQSVHFRSIEDTVNAVNNTDYKAWSVWEKNLLLCKGVGTDVLQSFLELLGEGGTNAIYTVRYYAKITDKDDIKSTTPHDGAFNFKINGDGQEITKAEYGSFKYSNELSSRVSGLEEKLDRIAAALEEEIPEEKPTNKLGIIGDIMAHPTIAPMIPSLLNMIFGNTARPSALPTVGNIPAPTMTDNTEINKAVQNLLQYDPKLCEHLQKLAAIAQKDPATFTMIISSLDNYNA